ncbi:putative MHC class I antigen protein, partial [Naja naja]
PPGVTVVRGKTEVEDGMETHVCRLDGFYPREIDASWTRDGEVWEEETFHGSLAPNVDGTYHYWLSIRIDPKERGRYRCHVEHWPCRSLWTWPWKNQPIQNPTWGSSSSAALWLLLSWWRQQDGYKAAKVQRHHHLRCVWCVCVCMCYLPLDAENQAGEDGPPFHYSQAVLGSGVLKEKHLGQGNPEEDEAASDKGSNSSGQSKLEGAAAAACPFPRLWVNEG